MAKFKIIAALVICIFLSNVSFGMYDPQTGRFMQRDPIGTDPAGGKQDRFNIRKQFSDGSNLYQYTQSNPTINSDPHGLSLCPVVNNPIPPRDNFLGNMLFCCNGVRYNPFTHCCIKNRVFSKTSKIPVQVCWRKAMLPGGTLGDVFFGLHHMWLKTEYCEVGLGEEGGTGAPDTQEEKGCCYPRTGVVDHSGEADREESECISINVPRCCINDHMQQRATGKRCGPSYNCNTYVYDSLKSCGVDTNTVSEMIRNADPSWFDYWMKGYEDWPEDLPYPG